MELRQEALELKAKSTALLLVIKDFCVANDLDPQEVVTIMTYLFGTMAAAAAANLEDETDQESYLHEAMNCAREISDRGLIVLQSKQHDIDLMSVH